MDKQQLGYKLGKLYMKINHFARRKAEQYHVPDWLVYSLLYTPVVILALFSFMLFAAVAVAVTGLMITTYLVMHSKGSGDYEDEYIEEGLNEGPEGYGYYDKDGWRIIGDD